MTDKDRNDESVDRIISGWEEDLDSIGSNEVEDVNRNNDVLSWFVTASDEYQNNTQKTNSDLLKGFILVSLGLLFLIGAMVFVIARPSDYKKPSFFGAVSSGDIVGQNQLMNIDDNINFQGMQNTSISFDSEKVKRNPVPIRWIRHDEVVILTCFGEAACLKSLRTEIEKSYSVVMALEMSIMTGQVNVHAQKLRVKKK